ncbi:MAG TPA: TusE/DsrC/DsvC family sulfur relay protein [Marinobacter sp.]|jgi:tRNA 2-thiouridine synthesizing protein E|nr:TusE/DsrC/DsvC family sulfur relay protein [Marinobacter sp.]
MSDKPTPMPLRNNEGFLENASDWHRDVAQAIAAEAELELTDNHWEIIEFLRDFYRKHEMSPPSNRLFVKAVREAFGENKGNSIYLMQLFPATPAKTACRIAGLPRPTNCL